MSSKARRLPGGVETQAFDWSSGGAGGQPVARAPAVLSMPALAPPQSGIDPAVTEREAFAQGFAQGEHAGAEVAGARAAQVLRRLGQTIEELTALRVEIFQKSERQVVQLAVAMAKRIVHREISLDADLIAAMARVALDRMGEDANATIRLHPDDYAATAGARGHTDAGAVRVVADPAVRRGGCLVHSDFGLIDVSADAQIAELATALLGAQPGSSELQPQVSLAS